MELISFIIGLSGFTLGGLFITLKKVIFKQNIEFHNILQTFPIISDSRIDNGTKTSINTITNIQISKEFTEFVETKRGELDEFLAKLERFDESKLRFKKKEITSFTNNIKRLLTSKATNIQIEFIVNMKTNETTTTTKTTGKQFEWSAFHYIMVDKIMKEKKNVDKLYVCKLLKF